MPRDSSGRRERISTDLKGKHQIWRSPSVLNADPLHRRHAVSLAVAPWKAVTFSVETKTRNVLSATEHRASRQRIEQRWREQKKIRSGKGMEPPAPTKNAGPELDLFSEAAASWEKKGARVSSCIIKFEVTITITFLFYFLKKGFHIKCMRIKILQTPWLVRRAKPNV